MFAFVLVSVAMAQAIQSPDVQPQIQVNGPPRPHRICHMVQDTGSRIGGYRVCQTQQERDQELAENQRDAERAVNQVRDQQFGDVPFSQFAMPPGTRVRTDELSPHTFSSGPPH